MVDKNFCMSAYLMYRYVYDDTKSFADDKYPKIVDLSFPRNSVKNAEDLLECLRNIVTVATRDGNAALALSGGIDSAILAKLMPAGSTAYTFKCVVDGKKVIDETPQASKWADLCGLNHKIVEIHWSDIQQGSLQCMLNKNAPVHSIEAQIYTAALQARSGGFNKFIFGENADIIYGGMNGLLAKDWYFAEFVDRYSYVMPYKVLKDFDMPLNPFREFEIDGRIDGYDFTNKYFRQEALGTYNNACETAGIEFIAPYALTRLDIPVDYSRIRAGDTKYIVREVFRMLYPDEDMPAKIPMPRPMDQWLGDWSGPVIDEFIPHCTDLMNGDQKWMIYCLENYIKMIGGGSNMFKVVIGHADNYRIETLKAVLSECFIGMGYPLNNPLGNVVSPGDRVFIKPNWVASKWRESCPHRDSLYCVITHPNIIEAIADYVAEALRGDGEIIIGDNPSIDADFNELMDFTGIKRLESKYSGISVKILDLRPKICTDLRNYGKKNLMIPQQGDPLGEVTVNLGKYSLLYGLDSTRFRGVFDEREDTVAAHTGENQLYTFSKSLFDADVYISVPKLKTHQKVGVTLNLKGLVGTVADKNQLVHWRVGYPAVHGDEYPSEEAYELGQKAKIKHRGAWFGNDTIWRMVVDLYQAILRKNRRYFTVIDGITAGEGQGPFCPTSKNANTVIVGDNLLAADIVATRFMGINPDRIRYLEYLIKNPDEFGVSYDDIQVTENGLVLNDFFNSDDKYLDFHVVQQWKCIKDFNDLMVS